MPKEALTADLISFGAICVIQGDRPRERAKPSAMPFLDACAQAGIFLAARRWPVARREGRRQRDGGDANDAAARARVLLIYAIERQDAAR